MSFLEFLQPYKMDYTLPSHVYHSIMCSFCIIVLLLSMRCMPVVLILFSTMDPL